IGVPAGTASRVPLADLISVGFGRMGRDASAVLAVALTMGTMNVYLGGAAKLAATLAVDGVLPAWLARGGGRSVARRSLFAVAVIAGAVLLGLLAGISTTTDLGCGASALFISGFGLAVVSAIRILDSHARLAAIASLGGILSLAAFSTGFLAVPLVAAAIALVLRRALRLARPPAPALPSAPAVRYLRSCAFRPSVCERLEEFELDSHRDESSLTGRVVDRPSCTASLTVLRDLGISIVSVNPVE